jgi:hypothetical protein
MSVTYPVMSIPGSIVQGGLLRHTGQIRARPVLNSKNRLEMTVHNGTYMTRVTWFGCVEKLANSRLSIVGVRLLYTSVKVGHSIPLLWPGHPTILKCIGV